MKLRNVPSVSTDFWFVEILNQSESSELFFKVKWWVKSVEFVDYISDFPFPVLSTICQRKLV